MKRKILPFVIALPAFILVLLFKVWPDILSVIISFMQYSPKLGLSNSPFIGLTNYTDFITSYYFMRLLRNSIILSLLPAILTSVVSLFAILCIRKLPNQWLKCLALCIIAIPALIPLASLIGSAKALIDSDSAIAMLFYRLHIIEVKSNLLTIPNLYPWVYSGVEVLKYMFFPIAIGVLATDGLEKPYMHRLFGIIGSYVFIRFALFYVINREITIQLYNPMVYETADTLGAFTYRKGLLEANYGYNAVVSNIRNVFQVLFSIPLFIGLNRLLNRNALFYCISDRKNKRPSAIAGILGTLPLCTGTAGIVYFFVSGALSANITAADIFSNPMFVPAMGNSFVYSIIGAALFTILSVLLAYPFTVSKKAYPLVLFLVLSVNSIVAEYLNYRSWGFIDNAFGAIFISGLSILGAFVLHYLTVNQTRDAVSFKGYLRVIAPTILVLFAFGFIAAWGCSNIQMMLQTRSKFPVSLILREMFVQNDLTKFLSMSTDSIHTAAQLTAIKHIMGILMSLPPVFVGWAVIWLNKRLFIGNRTIFDMISAKTTEKLHDPSPLE